MIQFKQSKISLTSASQQSAEFAGLRYVNHEAHWFRRKRKGRGFIYLDAADCTIRDMRLQQRFKLLVIPPAWEDVYICPSTNGHIQVTGRDLKGRKQYIYHPHWEKIRNLSKFQRMLQFAECLPIIRRKINSDLKEHTFSKRKVSAIVVKLLEETHIRIGNTQYARQNGSYGLTTLQDKHLKVTGSHLHFMFRGKSGKEWNVNIADNRLARLVKQCQELPGQELFQYFDEKRRRQSIHSEDVNNYLKEITGEDFTAKDFRTWHGTVMALKNLNELEPCSSKTERLRRIPSVIKQVARNLINTPSICRKYYIHPEIISAYTDGTLCSAVKKATAKHKSSPFGLSLEEEAVIIILRNFIKKSKISGRTGSKEAGHVYYRKNAENPT